MKRNMKFLLLLAIFTSSIMAACFITGCGDDSTVIEFPPNVTNDTTVIVEAEDRVLGSIQGVVSSKTDNSLLSGITVTWTKNDADFTTTTNAAGYYLIDDSLSSGYYVISYSGSSGGITFATFTETVYIPTIGDIKDNLDDNNPVGEVEFMVTQDADLYATSASVTGVLYTALPAPEDKDGTPSKALDGDPTANLASGVWVYLAFDADIHPNVFSAQTDVNGVYSFNAVPQITADERFTLMTAPFVKTGPPDTAYAATKFENLEMAQGGVTIENIFAPVVGSGDDPEMTNEPVVLFFNFEDNGFGVTNDLTFLFSKEMQPNGFGIDFLLNSDTVDFAFAWTSDFQVLTINPALSLLPDSNYTLELVGKSADGIDLWDNKDDDAIWNRGLNTQVGMRFVSTNLTAYGDDSNPFTEFPLGADITIDFDMNVDGNNPNGFVKLIDSSINREVNAAITYSGVTVTINPALDLESFKTYELDFNVYSDLRGDFVDDSEVKAPKLRFTTVNNVAAPDAASDFDTLTSGFVADFDDLSVSFKWAHVPRAEWYLIYAMDNHNNTDLIVVSDTIWDQDYLNLQTGTVDLSTAQNQQFDLFDEDAIQTPFSDSTELTFQLLSGNPAGVSGFSNVVVIGDKQAPNVVITQGGVADNAARAEDTTFAINFGGMEYVDSVEFVFSETGGDPAYVFTGTDVTYVWDNDMRGIDTAYVTIPAGKTGSADFLTVNVWDNSGNMGTDTTSLFPWIVVDMPNDTTMNFMAPTYNVQWTSTDPLGSYDWLNIWFSLDGGVTWLDSASSLLATADDGIQAYTVDDTLYSVNALIGIQDTAAGGGWMWNSDAFTWTGVKLTAPDSVTWDTMTVVYDDGGVDSTDVPFTFASAGIDSLVIVYTDDNWVSTYTHDTILANAAIVDTINYTWNAPDLGGDYNCEVGIRDLDGARPIHTFDWNFPVINDYTDITAPATGNTWAGGIADTIRWDTTVYAPHLTTAMVQIDYTLDQGATWVSISSSTANDGVYGWTVPADGYANDSAQVRIRDITDMNTLDVTGNFTISGIVVDSPMTNSEWVGGTSHDILWHTIGAPGTINLWYSHSGFTDADSVQIVAATADDGTHTWSVPNEGDSTVWIRATTNTDSCSVLAGPFLIAAVVVTSPNGGETLANGANTTVTWDEYGSAIDSVYIEYSVEGGAWIMVDSMANAGTYTWLVPDAPSDSVSVRVSQVAGHTGSDVCDAPFKIAGLTMNTPNGGETWVMGTTETITWSEFGIVGSVKLEYTINNGIDWWTIAGAGIVMVGTETFDWDMDPAVDVNLTGPSTDCFVRVTENNPADPGNILSDAGNAKFEIRQPTIVVTAPNGGETWTINGGAQNITWTEADVVANVKVEYTLDGTTWFPVAGAQNLVAGTLTYSWPMTVAADPDLAVSVVAEVRVSTVTGVTTTDESDAVFTIN